MIVKFINNKINIILGENAVGKTSVVEAINVLGSCKSHKTNNDKEIIKKSEEFYSIKAYIEDEIKEGDFIRIEGRLVKVNYRINFITFLFIILHLHIVFQYVKKGTAEAMPLNAYLIRNLSNKLTLR